MDVGYPPAADAHDTPLRAGRALGIAALMAHLRSRLDGKKREMLAALHEAIGILDSDTNGLIAKDPGDFDVMAVLQHIRDELEQIDLTVCDDCQRLTTSAQRLLDLSAMLAEATNAIRPLTNQR